MLGHDGPPAGYWRENLLTGQALGRCPVRTQQLAAVEQPELTQELQRYTEHYVPAFDSHLLVAGGLAAQPARYLEIVRMVRETDARAERKYLELTRKAEEE